MSYTRFGCDGSDIYVIPTHSGLECCGCPLGMAAGTGSYYTRDIDAFHAHLEAHTAAGHHVPDYLTNLLESERQWMIHEGVLNG